MKKKDIKDLNYYERRLLQKTLTMFKWKNVPDEIPLYFLNLVTFTQGQVGLVRKDDRYYACTGGDGGTKIDAYNRSDKFIGANPEFSINCPIIWNTVDEVPEGDCAVVLWNDSFRWGILDLVEKYACQLMECDKSIRIALRNTRDTKMIKASTDTARAQAQVALDKMYEGEPYAFYDDGTAIGFGESKSLFDNSSKNNHLQDLIETRADILSRYCIEIGIPLVNNTKRSQLISGELGGIKTLGLINVDDMLDMRIHFCKVVNYAFGLDIDVELNDNWKIEVDYMDDHITDTLVMGEDMQDETTETLADAPEQSEEQSDEQSEEQNEEQNETIIIEETASQIIEEVEKQLEDDEEDDDDEN